MTNFKGRKKKIQASSFKKGHAACFRWFKSDVGDTAQTSVKEWDRLPRATYDMSRTQLPFTPCVLRPATSPVKDPWGEESVGAAASQISAGNEIAVDKQQLHLDHCSPVQQKEREVQKTQGIEGSRRMDMSKMAEMMNSIYHMHHQQSENCAGHFIFPAELEKLWGLGTTVDVQCVLCNFKRHYELYQETENLSQKGRKAAQINVQLGAFLKKSHIPYSDTRLLFAPLNIPPPSEHCIEKQVDSVSNQWPEVNVREMERNCGIVHTLMKHQSCAQSKKITCMSDTVYNNPPKGRAMNQPGTHVQIFWCSARQKNKW